jgi:hypothetical protein
MDPRVLVTCTLCGRLHVPRELLDSNPICPVCTEVRVSRSDRSSSATLARTTLSADPHDLE